MTHSSSQAVHIKHRTTNQNYADGTSNPASDCPTKSSNLTHFALRYGESYVIIINYLPPFFKILLRLSYFLVPINIFIIFLWFFLPFTFEGKPLFSVGPLVGTHEGVLYATQITIKSNAIVVVLIALVSSTSILTLGHAMHELRVPKKIVHLFFFTYRYVHVIYREYFRLVNAMKVRGFRPGTNIHTYKTFAYLVGMLLVRSCDRAQRVHRAMLCRGFRGNLYSLSEFSLRTTDVISLILMLALILALGVLEWTRMV